MIPANLQCSSQAHNPLLKAIVSQILFTKLHSSDSYMKNDFVFEIKKTTGVRAPLALGGGGAVTLLPEKNYTMRESMCSTNALKSQKKQKRSQFLCLMNVLSFQNYSRIPIFQTSKGNENWLEKSDVSRNLG